MKNAETILTQYGERFGHETGRPGSIRTKTKTERCEPEDTLRRSKAVLEVRGETSWLPGAPELGPVAHRRLFRA